MLRLISGNLTSARVLNPNLSYDPAKNFSLTSLLASRVMDETRLLGDIITSRGIKLR